jgi:hypothetical protein
MHTNNKKNNSVINGQDHRGISQCELVQVQLAFVSGVSRLAMRKVGGHPTGSTPLGPISANSLYYCTSLLEERHLNDRRTREMPPNDQCTKRTPDKQSVIPGKATLTISATRGTPLLQLVYRGNAPLTISTPE